MCELPIRQRGFTLIEILVVMILLAVLLSAVLPVSYNMVRRYGAAMRAQEVMLYISGLRRDAFLYSEKHLLGSLENTLTVDGASIPFADVQITVEPPIFFYSNGTTTGGRIDITVDGERYLLHVTAPFGTLSLEPAEEAA
ncbi:MAG: type II secretion system protein [Syntrophus sp. (in: bacteria)]|nr:type II secretion system protein [Syntrophus sp. (in: bacteria)]